MSEDSRQNDKNKSDFESDSSGGRQKQKIRIKYQQRVKVKKRPRGYEFTRYWKKHKKNLAAYLVLIILLGATFFMVVQVAKQQLEMNQHKTRQKL